MHGCDAGEWGQVRGRLTRLAALPQLGSDGVPVCMAAMQVSEGGQGGRVWEGRGEPPGLMMLVKKLQLRGATLGGDGVEGLSREQNCGLRVHGYPPPLTAFRSVWIASPDGPALRHFFLIFCAGLGRRV